MLVAIMNPEAMAESYIQNIHNYAGLHWLSRREDFEPNATIYSLSVI